MPIVRLPDRALITVSGPDAEHLLQNIVTTDLDALKQEEVKPGALLTPQGKIMFDFLVSRTANGALQLDLRKAAAADLAKRLMLYRLRAKAEIETQDQPDIVVAFDSDSSASETDSTANWLIDTRFSDNRVRRAYASGLEATATVADWNRMRIRHGVAESGEDYALGDAFPHDVLLDQNGGVGFKKGCYVGQEVVSRMQHRGTARRRVLIANTSSVLPAPGTPITAGGREIGTLGSVEAGAALAIARIDKVKDAMDRAEPIFAGEAEIALRLPDWVTFSFPEAN